MDGGDKATSRDTRTSRIWEQKSKEGGSKISIICPSNHFFDSRKYYNRNWNNILKIRAIKITKNYQISPMYVASEWKVNDKEKKIQF